MDLVLRLAPDRAEPLYAQIAAGVREAVAAGVLHPGQALPSTREMARTLGVARNTVIAAYAQLADEGYLNVRQAGRTRVSAALPDDGFPRPDPSVTARFDVPDTPALRYLAAAGPAPPAPPPLPFDFRLGRPALDRFPSARWKAPTCRTRSGS